MDQHTFNHFFITTVDHLSPHSSPLHTETESKIVNHTWLRRWLVSLTCRKSCCSSRIAGLRSRGWRGRARLQIDLRNGNAHYFATTTELLYKSIQTINVSPGVEIRFIWNWPLTHIQKKSPAHTRRVSTTSNDKISNFARLQLGN